MPKAPVLFIVFNRPEPTARVFEVIKKNRPHKLFIAADGPRADQKLDDGLCKQVREIVKSVDWPCELKTRFQETNLGCKIHVSSSIKWFFEHVESGIILEDDCLPNDSFFRFSNEMLERYQNEKEVFAVNGANLLKSSSINSPFTYRFSRIIHVWGWATWRRAWCFYDINMKDINRLAESAEYIDLFKNKKHITFWTKLFAHIEKKQVDTWDAQWQYSILINRGLVISPNINMVENIGFGVDATHTKSESLIQNTTAILENNINTPTKIEADKDADDHLMKQLYVKSTWQKILSRIR